MLEDDLLYACEGDRSHAAGLPFVEGSLQQLNKSKSRRVTAQLRSLAADVVGPWCTLGVDVHEDETRVLFVDDKWPSKLVSNFLHACVC